DERLIKKVKDVNDTLHLKSRIGLIATGDSFMSDPERVTEIRQRFPDMLAAEMEAVAIAQVCYQYEIPFVVIRALSDIAGKKSEISFDEFLDTAARNASNFIVEFLKTYLKQLIKAFIYGFIHYFFFGLSFILFFMFIVFS